MRITYWVICTNGLMMTEPEHSSWNVSLPGVMEGMAVVWWLSTYGDLCHGKRVLLETDSASVVFALDCCYSKRPAMMEVVVDVMSLCCKYHIVLRMRHVSGVVYNCIADRLSHNDPEQAKCLALIEFKLPLLLE